jgi:AAA family ATP:ADP antiporter
MSRFFERVLNLSPGDFGRGILLLLYLLLVIASYVIGKNARDALYLVKLGAGNLPYADLTIAISVGFVVAAYVRVGQKFSVRNLLVGSSLFFAAVCVVFWGLIHYADFKYTVPAFYVWVGVFGVLAPAQVWTLANYVLTTRQAKRVFGMVGFGAIMGWLVGGKLTSLIANKVNTEALLLVVGGAFVVCSVLIVLIWRQAGSLVADGAAASGDTERPTNFLQSLTTVMGSSYLRAIAAVICFSSFVTTMAGWQFKAIAKMAYADTDKLAAFFGDFNFYAAMICLATQFFLTSRLLRRFGIGPALFVVPVSMLFGAGAVAVAGTLWAAVVLKGSDQILRYSIDKSTVELLYLPIPAHIKLQVKWLIDTFIWRSGDGLAALLLLLFAKKLAWSPQQVSYVTMALIMGWMVSALVARRQYVGTLRDSIRQHRLDTEKATTAVLDRSTTDIIATNLRATDPKEVLYALSLFEAERQQSAHPAVRELLGHPAVEVRRKALSILSTIRDKTLLPQMEELLRDPDLEVRTEALLYLSRHTQMDPLERIQEIGDFADFSIRSAIVAFLARPGEAQNLDAARQILDGMVTEAGSEGQRTRLEAARLIGMVPDGFDDQLRLLVGDSDVQVAREAIRALGNTHKRKLLPELLERLGNSELAADAAEALSKYGDAIVGTLRDHLTDQSVSLAIRREIPGVLVGIGTQVAERALMENLLESDTTLRFRIISALNKIHQLHPNIEVDKEMMETVLAAEIMGHYRSYQVLGTLGETLESEDAVARGLKESMRQEVERIFRMLALLYPGYDFHSAYVGLQSKNAVVHDNALEFLDNILKPQMRELLVPLLDSEVKISDRVNIANKLLGAKVQDREQAVATLVASDDPWLKACGAYAIGTLGLRSLVKELDECMNHPDPLLRETARKAKIRLADAQRAAGV